MSAGLRNPRLSAAISATIAVSGALALWWGVSEMGRLGHETGATAGAIAVGGLAALFGVLLLINFLWAMRRTAETRAGEGQVARWTVPPEAFARFREADRALARTEGPNDYGAPREVPPGGIEVIFSADAVMIGDFYHGLSSTGLARFERVALRQEGPPALEFGTVLSRVTRHGAMVHDRGVLRAPVAPDAMAQAEAVLRHYQAVLAGKVVARPDFWIKRIRVGLGAAAVGLTAAGAGFALRDRSAEMADAPLIMAVAGVIVGAGGLILAAAAWGLQRAQRGGV